MLQIIQGTPKWFSEAISLEPNSKQASLKEVYDQLFTDEPERVAEDLKWIFNNYDPANMPTIIILAVLIISQEINNLIREDILIFGEKSKKALIARGEDYSLQIDRIIG